MKICKFCYENDDEKRLKRCSREFSYLNDLKMMDIIRALYWYKTNNKNVSYKFDGAINNFLSSVILLSP